MSLSTDVPDFSDQMRVIEQIKSLKVSSALIDTKIKAEESKIVRIVTTDADYFIDGKRPSMDYIRTVYFPYGLDGSLGTLREELAIQLAELEAAKNLLKAYSQKVDVWRTLESSKRAGV